MLQGTVREPVPFPIYPTNYVSRFMEVLTLFSYLPKGGFADKIHPALMVPVTRHRNSKVIPMTFEFMPGSSSSLGEYVAKMQVQAMCDRVAEVMQDEEQTMALEKNYTARARAMEEVRYITTFPGNERT